MQLTQWATIIAVALPAITGFIALLKEGSNPREDLKKDAEVLAMFPAGDPIRERYLEVVQLQIDSIERHVRGSRDLPTASFALALAIFLAWLMFRTFGWESDIKLILLPVYGFLLLVCLYGVFQSYSRVPRDEKNNPIKNNKKVEEA